MNANFIITKVSWLTQIPGNESRRHAITRHFYYVAKFLQDNGLVHRQLMRRLEDISDDFAIESNDLTEDGFSLMKSAYDSWLRKIDQGMDPSDISLLSERLKKIRAHQ